MFQKYAVKKMIGGELGFLPGETRDVSEFKGANLKWLLETGTIIGIGRPGNQLLLPSEPSKEDLMEEIERLQRVVESGQNQPPELVHPMVGTVARFDKPAIRGLQLDPATGKPLPGGYDPEDGDSNPKNLPSLTDEIRRLNDSMEFMEQRLNGLWEMVQAFIESQKSTPPVTDGLPMVQSDKPIEDKPPAISDAGPADKPKDKKK
jgi:hypothetical protein